MKKRIHTSIGKIKLLAYLFLSIYGCCSKYLYKQRTYDSHNSVYKYKNLKDGIVIKIPCKDRTSESPKTQPLLTFN